MNYLVNYTKWCNLHESDSLKGAQAIAAALLKAGQGFGTDEESLKKAVLSIDSLATIKQVNSILASTPGSEYKSLAELIVGELGSFDKDLILGLKSHIQGIVSSSPEAASMRKEGQARLDNAKSATQGKIVDGEYAVVLSNRPGAEVHLLFGGSHTSGYSTGSARPQNILKYAPLLAPYSDRVTIVITHHMNTLDRAREWVKKNLNGAQVTSIAGFSQGGKETWKHAENSSLKLVGLIDPSTYETGVRLGPNTYLVCNPDNWGSNGFYGEVKKRLTWYCQHQNDPGYSGRVECVKGIRHMDFGILKYFYKKFATRL